MNIVPIGLGPKGADVVVRLLRTQTGPDFIKAPITITGREHRDNALDPVPPENRLSPPIAPTSPPAPEAIDGLLSDVSERIASVQLETVHGFLLAVTFDGDQSRRWACRIAEHLVDEYIHPVYGLAIMPSELGDESKGALAGDRFGRFRDAIDQTIVFDWAGRSARSTGQDDRLVDGLALLFTVDRATQPDDTDVPVLAREELGQVLSGGGLTAIGYAVDRDHAKPTAGFIDRIREPTGSTPAPDNASARTLDLLREAVTDGLSSPCDIRSCAESLLLLGGPVPYLRAVDISDLRTWVAKQTETDTRVGTCVFTESDRVATACVLAGLPQIPSFEGRFTGGKSREEPSQPSTSDRDRTAAPAADIGPSTTARIAHGEVSAAMKTATKRLNRVAESADTLTGSRRRIDGIVESLQPIQRHRDDVTAGVPADFDPLPLEDFPNRVFDQLGVRDDGEGPFEVIRSERNKLETAIERFRED